jgi:hypothetical protein
MSDKQLLALQDYAPFKYEVEVLQEQTALGNINKRVFLKGILQRSDTLNQNGRIYPRDIMSREINNYQKLIRERRSYGALDHTDSPIVEFQTVSHWVTELRMEDDGVVYGKIEILPTIPHGQNALTLIERNMTIGISSRGVGTVDRDHNGHQVVQGDFSLCAFDLVTEPSTPGAFMMKESRIITARERDEVNKFLYGDNMNKVLDNILNWGNK